MIRLDETSPTDLTTITQSPAGFLWWYLELTNDQHDGVVLIWAYGLPFLPGLASAARAGQTEPPYSRPSLNVVTYSGGRQTHYALHEYHPAEVVWDGGGHWRFGDTHIRSDERGGRRHVEVSLSMALPNGERLVGTLSASGAPVVTPLGELPPGFDAASPHRWTPLLAAGVGEASVGIEGDAPHHVRGDAYHDRNRSHASLHDLGFSRWLWAHERHGDEDRIAYRFEPRGGGAPRAFGLAVSARETRVVAVQAQPQGARRHHYGMQTWQAITFAAEGRPWLNAELKTCVDSGPFYLRYLGRRGSVELIEPDRIDLAWQRPLVQMRVSRDGQRPSLWAPLFQGALHDRPARLGRHWRREAGRALRALLS